MNPFEGEVCRNGHTRDKDNTEWQYDGERNRYRKRCLECVRVKKKPRVHRPDPKIAEARGRIENVLELMDFGAEPSTIPERAGYAHKVSMRKALVRADRQDIWERFKAYEIR